MNIQVISEHSVAMDILPARAKVLDIGCRGFEFERYFTDKGHTVFCIDADPFIKNVPPAANFFLIAISDENGNCEIEHSPDPQATRIIKSARSNSSITMMTIESFTRMVNNVCGKIEWDLIKIDIEGEEVNVLKAAKHPIAKQVSVEFHAHCRPEQTRENLDELLKQLSQYYEIHNQVWESRHGAGFNYWDVLLIAK